MSGIYIKGTSGMFMPTDCSGKMIIRISSDGRADVQYEGMVGGIYTEAIFVPDHGDLIDRTELCEELQSDCDVYAGRWTFAELWEDDKETIMSLPVVIPADRSKE